jgi:hypothetical protein
MKTIHMIAATVVAVLAVQPSFAAPPETAAPMTMQMADHSAQHTAQMHAMMAKADQARTPAERSKLMAENMAMMKVHMADMSAMLNEKPMAMAASGAMPASEPMTMDAAHMAKMGNHMAMIHQMMESLMLQQQMMMKSGK